MRRFRYWREDKIIHAKHRSVSAASEASPAMVDSTRGKKIDAGNTEVIQVDETRCCGIYREGAVIEESRPIETSDFHVQAIIPNARQVSRSDIKGGAGRD